jgi:RNA polymerase sigma-32 factor
MSVLSDRELRVFAARRLAEDPISLQDLSNELGVSHQRVHQIERRAFTKVQMAVRVGELEHLQAQPTAIFEHEHDSRLPTRLTL